MMENLLVHHSKILIIDDQQANVDLLTSYLTTQGYNHLFAVLDSRKAVDLVKKIKPDLILLDLLMPLLSGLEVLERLHHQIASQAWFPILVLTADITPEAKQQALAGGATDFLIKPYSLVEVGLRIRNLLYVHHLQKQLRDQNHHLDDLVRERTLKLERANRKLIIARDKAESSDRLKTAFLQTISHEVRTPLTGILGNAALLSQAKTSQEKKEEYYQMMENSSKRLVFTINNYVDMALISSGNLACQERPVNLKELLKDVLAPLEPVCTAKGITLTESASLENPLPVFITDPVFLKKILIQLVDNAVKFTHQGAIEVGYGRLKDRLQWWVKDTGIGIASEKQQSIFEPFLQIEDNTSRLFEGNGLGLSIVRGFLRLLKGECRVESNTGLGTTVYFDFPWQHPVEHERSDKFTSLD